MMIRRRLVYFMIILVFVVERERERERERGESTTTAQMREYFNTSVHVKTRENTFLLEGAEHTKYKNNKKILFIKKKVTRIFLKKVYTPHTKPQNPGPKKIRHV